MYHSILMLMTLLLLVSGCGQDEQSIATEPAVVLRLAVTTSTQDSGLLDVIVPIFEKEYDARIDVISVGTGAALKLGESGDVDVVLVHAREAEEEFMAAGHGVRREDVMYNSFEIIGPKDDPAEIRMLEPDAALQKIASAEETFLSRGDESGTHKRERKIWTDGGGQPVWENYLETGQGMAATLMMADEMNAYVLCDRGTYLKLKEKTRLIPLVQSSEGLRNPYGIMVVNPKKNWGINVELANDFVDFIISSEIQQVIREYRIDGEQLFYSLQLRSEDE